MENRKLLIVVVLLVVLCNSIVYSALNSEMLINGDAYVRVKSDIRITDLKLVDQTGGAYETYNSDYSKNTTSMQITLPSSESAMIYEVTITNKGDIDYEVTNIIEESYSNNNIKYELIDIEDGSIIDRGTTHKFKIKFTTTENNTDNKTTLVLKYTFKEWIPTLYNMVAHKSRGLDTDIDFGVAPTKGTSGVYKMDSTKEDEFPVYYYRGIIDNNNVSFAGFCWKIVRTTSTGGVKLIYNGVPASDGSCNNTGVDSHIGTSKYNTGNKCGVTGVKTNVGYMYGEDLDINKTDSIIKTVIDEWYLANMIEYTNMLEDTIWCNDRSIYKISGDNIYFGGYGRLFDNNEPIVTCPRQLDSFTVDESNGNGKLIYPISLLTADEATLAGHGYKGYTDLGYLNFGQSAYFLTPASYNNVNECGFQPRMYRINFLGMTGEAGLNYNDSVRPSISLASGTMIKEGNGSVTSPYKIVEDKITKEWSFDYTGGEQEFKVPYDGVYKLEVWGAQGGTYNDIYHGGYGAYSTGNVSLTKGTNLYINIGEGGSNVCDRSYSKEGTYNGGGGAREAPWTGTTSAIECKGTGGGATHIATSTGQLKQLESNLQSIYLVACGGGSAEYFFVNFNPISSSYCIGGSGGGKIGNLATCNLSSNILSAVLKYTKATQEIGGIKMYKASYGNENIDGSFGAGSIGYSGGGGGYYGGAGGPAGAGGGSSYIGNSLLNNKAMYCYECEESNEESTKTISTTNVSEEPVSNYAKVGNGYAKITLIEKK